MRLCKRHSIMFPMTMTTYKTTGGRTDLSLLKFRCTACFNYLSYCHSTFAIQSEPILFQTMSSVVSLSPCSVSKSQSVFQAVKSCARQSVLLLVRICDFFVPTFGDVMTIQPRVPLSKKCFACLYNSCSTSYNDMLAYDAYLWEVTYYTCLFLLMNLHTHCMAYCLGKAGGPSGIRSQSDQIVGNE